MFEPAVESVMVTVCEEVYVPVAGLMMGMAALGEPEAFET